MIRAIDENGNIYGSLLIDSIDQLLQELECQLKLFKGENPYDLLEGIDWTYELQNYNEPRLRALIRDRILSVNNVSGIEGDVEMVISNRVLKVTALVLTSLQPLPVLFESEINGDTNT